MNSALAYCEGYEYSLQTFYLQPKVLCAQLSSPYHVLLAFDYIASEGCGAQSVASLVREGYSVQLHLPSA